MLQLQDVIARSWYQVGMIHVLLSTQRIPQFGSTQSDSLIACILDANAIIRPGIEALHTVDEAIMHKLLSRTFNAQTHPKEWMSWCDLRFSCREGAPSVWRPSDP